MLARIKSSNIVLQSNTLNELDVRIYGDTPLFWSHDLARLGEFIGATR